MDKKILAVVPARGGSKGIPGKNIRPLAGKPLIAYAIASGLESQWVSDLVVTTDSPEIQEISLRLGAQVPFLRPSHLATDTALAIPTIQDAVLRMEALKGFKYDYVIMLQPTAPMRTAADIDEALEKLITNGADSIISVVDVNNYHPIKMKRLSPDGFLSDYESYPIENPPRQSLPKVYIVNGAIYAVKRDVLMEGNSFKGKTCLGHVMPEERSVNIDSIVDFKVAEILMA